MNVENKDILFNKVVGKRLKDIRTSKQLTQTEVAKKIGVTFQQIQKYENGINALSLKKMLKLCEAMSIHYRYFCNCVLSDVEKLKGSDVALCDNTITERGNDVECN